MRIVVCHSHETLCGIRQYGEQLDRAFRALGLEVVTFTFATIPNPQFFRKGDVVLFHFEPALLHNVSGFEQVLKDILAAGGRTVFCCHWYERDAVDKYNGVVSRYVLHRIYPDAPPQYVQIPLGAPFYDVASKDRAALRQKFGFGDRFVLSTIGFLSDWKKTPEVIDQLAAVLPDGFLIRAQTPKPFTAIGKAYYMQDVALARVVEKHGSGKISSSIEFMPEEDLLDLVHASDLGFVFHSQDTSSVSAATKQYVSARTPVVVSGSTHSSDVIRGVKRVGTFSIEVFTREIVKTAQDSGLMEKLRAGIAKEYERINMNVVAQRYVDEFKKLVGG